MFDLLGFRLNRVTVNTVADRAVSSVVEGNPPSSPSTSCSVYFHFVRLLFRGASFLSV